MTRTVSDAEVVSLTLKGGENGRWQVKVEMYLPDDLRAILEGATIGLLNASGRPLGPAVVIPLENCLNSPVETSVRGPERLPPSSILRCTIFIGTTQEPLVVDQRVSKTRGFHGFIMGLSSIEEGPRPKGRGLTEAEQNQMEISFPWLKDIQQEDLAFDAFKEDILSAMDLDEHDEVTEEILRMLKEP